MRLMKHEDLMVVVDYLRRELVGKKIWDCQSQFVVEIIYIVDGHLVFEGRDLNKKSPFKISYVVDEQGDLHPMGVNRES